VKTLRREVLPHAPSPLCMSRSVSFSNAWSRVPSRQRTIRPTCAAPSCFRHKAASCLPRPRSLSTRSTSSPSSFLKHLVLALQMLAVSPYKTSVNVQCALSRKRLSHPAPLSGSPVESQSSRRESASLHSLLVFAIQREHTVTAILMRPEGWLGDVSRAGSLVWDDDLPAGSRESPRRTYGACLLAASATGWKAGKMRLGYR